VSVGALVDPAARRAPGERARPAVTAPAVRTGSSAGRVRPATAADLAAIVALHRGVFGPRPDAAPGELEALLAALFFGHPWRDAGLASLVYEEEGEIVGSLGVLPRPMRLGGRPILAALGHNFTLRADRRTSLAAIEMLRVFLAGPQELSYTFGNDTTRHLWRGVGVEPSLPLSLRFTTLLRPAAHVAGVATRRSGSVARVLARRAGSAADLWLTRLPRNPFRPRASELASEPLDVATLATLVERYARRRPLAPRYDAASLPWMLDRLARRPGALEVRCRLLRRGGALAGWYVATLERSGVAKVEQLGAVPKAADAVFDALRADAWRAGATALTGMVEPSMLGAIGRPRSLVHRGAGTPWLMAHGNPEAVAALQSGQAFVSGLEGEWWA